MADDNKLWFEMGVRDNVTNSLGKILEMTKVLGGEMDKVVTSAEMLGKIGKVKFDNGQAVRNALSYKNMLVTIDNMMTKISERRVTAKVGVDKLDKAVANLEQFRNQLLNLQKISGDGWNGDILRTQQTAMRNVLNVVNGLLREQAQEQRNASSATLENAKANKDLAATYAKVEKEASGTSRIMGQLQNQFNGIVSLYGAERLLKNIIKIGGEFEVQHIALQSILGDIQQANSMFEQEKELAVVSPFNFRELVTYSKQVAAFGIPYEEMFDTTKRLADMSAGLGVDMQRLILAYGQVRSAAVLRGQELRQFTEAGIPMVRALADEFTKLNGRVVSTAEVFDLIRNRSVPFEMVKKVLWDMTNEGGRFYDMQYTLADTLAGKWSNLQDAWEIMLSDFAKGESISGKMLKGVVTLITDIIEHVNVLAPLIAGLAVSFSSIKVAKWTKGFGNLGFNKIDQNVEKAQKLRAIELSRQKINGEITRSQYTQLMQQNLNKGNYYKILAMEGKLNALQIQRAYTQGHINKQELAYLVQLKAITNEERKQILMNNLNVGIFGRMSFAAKNFARSVNAAMGPMGWIILAVDLIASGLFTWYSRVSEINEKNKQLVEGLEKHRKELSETLKDSTKTPTNDEEYKSSIEGMKEMLKQHFSNYNAIILEAEGLTTLADKYEYLKKALYETNDAYRQAETLAPDFANSTRDAFNDVKEWARELSKKKGAGRFEFSFDWDELEFSRNETIFLRRVKDLANKIKEEIPNIGKESGANNIYRQLRNSLEEELGIGEREKLFINIKLDELLHIEDDDALADIVTDKFSTAIGTAAPRIANKIRNGRELNKAEESKVQELINAAIQDTEAKYPLFANRLQSLLDSSRFTALVRLNFAKTGNTNDLQKFVYGNFDDFVDENIKTIATGWAMSGSMFSAQNAAKSDIDAAFNEKVSRQKALDRLKKDKKAEKKQIDQAQKLVDETNTKYNNLRTAALVGLGYDYDGVEKRSNKVGGEEKDVQLEAVKNRVDLYKKFYTELENYTKLYGSQSALNKLKGDGEFGAVFGWKLSDVSNYKKSVTELTSTLKNSSKARDEFLNSSKADIQAKQRKDETEAVRVYISELQRMMSVMSENYQTYKKWVELTGDTALAASIAGVTENTNYAEWLTGSMKEALSKSDLKLKPEDVFDMKESDVVGKFGKDSPIFSIWDEWQKNQKKVKKDSIDLFENALKNAKDFQDEIDDLNRELERTIENIDKMPNVSKERKTKLRQSATENTQEKIDSILYEQFKKDSDWNKIFENLDNVTYETITTLIEKMKEFSTQATIDAKNTKEWVDAWNKLNDAAVERNPFGMLFSTIKTSGEIKSLLKNNKDQNSFVLSAEQAARYGLKVNRKDTYSRRELSDAAMGLDKKSGGVWTGLAKKFKVLQDALQPVIDLFDELGNTTLSDIFKAGNNALTSAANTAGAFSKLGEMAKDGGMAGLSSALSSAGPYAAAAAAAIQIASTAISMFGADYSDYNRMKEQYENLIDVWDDLIDRKREYLSENWGTEAKNAGREILGLMQSEMEQTRIIAEKRLKAGKSAGSHTLEYRMWQGSYKYNGQNWKDVAKGISQQLGGVKFTEMGDLLNMTSEQLLWIKTNYAGLWSTMDNDFKGYLDELIKYSDTEKEILDDLQEKLTGMDFEDVVSDYASCLSDMMNGNKELGKNLRDNLKDAILNAMVANVYGDRIKELISMTNELGSNGERVFDANGRIMSEYTKEEMDLIEAFSDKLDEDMEASRNKLRDLYGWKSDGDSSSQNAIGKAITEQDTSLWASYWNAMRLDISVIRSTEAMYLPLIATNLKEMPVVAKAQVENLEQIVGNTKRNADAADKIYNLLHGIAPDGTGWKIK